ncbi:RNA-binding protein [Fusarium heterosporum]|uniref:RNA-binding protein n=1 Tax=Fusarium heterosporum TaxID=42747 RepID=A0A8H5TR46_FUSHE|nr:RNA-binding protein [Fusarium heterosporum]
MAYPPPPGISNSSLPPRPPASKSGFKPAFSAAAQVASKPVYSSAPPTYSGPSSYPAANAPSTAQYGPSYSSYSTTAPGAVSSGAPYSYAQQPQSYGPQSHGAQSYGPQSYEPQSYGAAPQIKNPFPTPGTAAAAAVDYNPEMAAQIAQWQSAYSSAPADSKDRSVGPAAVRTDGPTSTAAAAAAANEERKKTVVREGGGKKWTDDSLLEWDPSHLRLFVGNLAGETTDDALLKAFSRWQSVQKARVIRDKRTSKSKGYGFVSFSDADDFFQAAKEMNGKYIQSHPVTVRKANTEIKVANVKDRDRNGRKNKNKNKKGGNGGGDGGSAGYEPSLGPVGASGVVKPGQKTKNGLRLLG